MDLDAALSDVTFCDAGRVLCCSINQIFLHDMWLAKLFKSFFFLIEDKLLYRILLLSVKPQCESAVGIHISLLL